MFSSTMSPTTHSYPVGKEFPMCRSLDMRNVLADNLEKKPSTGLYTSQLFHLQMKITTLTTYILYLSIKM